MTPATRREREQAILEIVEELHVHTQSELVGQLHTRGFQVTQATVSRDIKRLGIVKLPAPDAAPRYASPEEAASIGNGPGNGRALQDLAETFRESVLSVDSGDALLAVRTPPGHANAAAVVMDRARIPEVIATLAGDDTILVLVRRPDDRTKVRRLLEGFL